MHEFTTDILRIRIRDDAVGQLLRSSTDFAEAFRANPDVSRRRFYLDCLRRTLAEALARAGSLLLDIEDRELDTTLHPASNVAIEKEIIIFDTAPGGAGYSQQLAERIRDVFVLAQGILENCPGSCGDSCYRCLRSYQNQPFHKRLNRKFASEGLRAFNAANWA
jgi:ATP-dependent helicase YprA (DUF1998 family)